MASIRNICFSRITQGIGNIIRIDEILLSTQPMDMRAAMDTAMALVVRALGYIKPHCAYLFCNKRGHRIEHEPASTQCACGYTLRCIGEDISEKLNFRPAQFYKEQHIRGKWVCDQCDILTQQAMPAYVIDKGIATPELLSHVLVSKYADHLPLYRQRQIFLRAGVDLSRSTLSDWIGRCGVELEPLTNALK